MHFSVCIMVNLLSGWMFLFLFNIWKILISSLNCLYHQCEALKMSVWSCEMNRRRFLNKKIKKIVDIYDVRFLYYVFSLIEIPRNNIIPLFLQSRHDFMVRAAQPFKTRYKRILKSSKQQRTKQKAEKNPEWKKKEKGHCVSVCMGVCLLPDACRGACEVSWGGKSGFFRLSLQFD